MPVTGGGNVFTNWWESPWTVPVEVEFFLKHLIFVSDENSPTHLEPISAWLGTQNLSRDTASTGPRVSPGLKETKGRLPRVRIAFVQAETVHEESLGLAVHILARLTIHTSTSTNQGESRKQARSIGAAIMSLYMQALDDYIAQWDIDDPSIPDASSMGLDDFRDLCNGGFFEVDLVTSGERVMGQAELTIRLRHVAPVPSRGVTWLKAG